LLSDRDDLGGAHLVAGGNTSRHSQIGSHLHPGAVFQLGGDLEGRRRESISIHGNQIGAGHPVGGTGQLLGQLGYRRDHRVNQSSVDDHVVETGLRARAAVTDHQVQPYLLVKVHGGWSPHQAQLFPGRLQLAGIGQDARVLAVEHGVCLSEIGPPLTSIGLRAWGGNGRRIDTGDAGRGVPDDRGDRGDVLRSKRADEDLDESPKVVDTGHFHPIREPGSKICADVLELGPGVGHLHRNHADPGELGFQRGLMRLHVGVVDPDADPSVVGPIDPNIPKAVEGLGEHPHLVDGHLVADIDGGVGVPVLWGVGGVDVLARHHLDRGHGARRDGARLWLTAECGLGAGDDTQER